MPLGMEVGLSPGEFVLDGDPAPFPKRGVAPQFSAHVYCSQTAAWIKMPLGMEVGFGLRDIVFDVNPGTPEKKGTPATTQFLSHVYCGQTAGWMKTPLGTETDLGLGHIVLGGGASSRERGTAAPLRFSAHVYCGHGRPSQLLLNSCLLLVVENEINWLIYLKIILSHFGPFLYQIID